ncbi:component of SufBCD complex [Celeribacter sp.]|uniref:component of SufBCD complex n=1 Tax=Celeribacter sp. TaxID=1890673 RepID=UPI003A958B0A
MNIWQTVLEVIDMRSFSNLWYWIALAVLWSTASHFVLGVPFDLAQKAQKLGGERMQDLEDLVRINVNRLGSIAEISGLVIVAIASATLTMLFGLGVFYDVEFAQAVFLMAFPMTIIFYLNVRTAQRIQAEAPRGNDLVDTLRRHRFKTQLIGMLFIFITAMWGMYQNIVTGPLGG